MPFSEVFASETDCLSIDDPFRNQLMLGSVFFSYSFLTVLRPDVWHLAAACVPVELQTHGAVFLLLVKHTFSYSVFHAMPVDEKTNEGKRE